MDARTAHEAARPALYHLHIPKTAGTSLHALLAGCFPAHAVCPIGPSLELLRIPREEFRRFDFFSGHLQFGLYLQEVLQRPVRVVTFLRDPVTTALSRYKQVCQEPKDPVRPYVDAHCPGVMEFFSDPLMSAYTANSLCRYLAEDERLLDDEARGQIERAGPDEVHEILRAARLRHQSRDADELLQRARQRLDECALVGVVERMEASIERLSQIVGCPLSSPTQLNRSADARTAGDLPEALRRRLDKLTTLDRQLYDEALARFDAA